MTGDDFRALRAQAGLSIRLAAKLCEVSPTTIQAWERADAPRLPVTAIERLHQAAIKVPEPHRIGYAMGRLFAVLNEVADDNLPDAYYTQIVDDPPYAFPLVFAWARRSAERYRAADPEIMQLMASIPASGFPAHLDEAMMGAFWIGYYHRRGDAAER